MNRPAMAALIAATCLRLHGQAARDPDDVLAQVRAKLHSMTERLPRYTCVQTVERRYLRHAERKGPPPSCDQISGDPDDVLAQVRAKLHSMTERLPRYTWAST